MFSKEEAAELVYTSILSAMKMSESFILCKIMKNVNLLSLAKTLSDKEVEIIGKRPGEKLNETLISKNELPYTNIVDDFVFIHTTKQNKNLHEEHSSKNAKDMSKHELEKLIHENNI